MSKIKITRRNFAGEGVLGQDAGRGILHHRAVRSRAQRALDGAEFVGPGSDIALGLYRFAPFHYGLGFNKPNGTGECLVGLKPTTCWRNWRAKARLRKRCMIPT